MNIRADRRPLRALALAGALLWMAPAALADGVAKMCRQDAREERVLCKLGCAEDFQVALDECRGVDHGCAEACRAARRVCLDLPFEGLDACRTSCTDTRDDAVALCRETYDAETQAEALDDCVDDAQIEGFRCRDTCREAIDRDEVRTCRKAFRTCVRTCPREK